MILVITITGAFGAIASARTGGRAARWLMRRSPPSSIPHCTVTRARLRSQPAGRWPAPSSTMGRNNTANPGERSASAPGPSRPESRSSNAGIPVKCSRNRRQVRRNPQSRPASGVTARSFAWTAAGRLFVSDYYVEGESPEDRAASTLALIRRRFHGADTVTPIDARVGWRPMPADGMPIVGFTPDAPGLYLAVMHAGVVMAPVVGPARHRRDRGRQRGRGIGALPRVPLRIASELTKDVQTS